MKQPSKSNPNGHLHPGLESSGSKTVGRLVTYCGVLFPLVMGLVVLVGWFFKLPHLTTIVPGFVAMRPNTATGFFLAALSLALLLRQTKARIVLGKILALLVFALGSATMTQYIFGSDFRIDSLLVGVPLAEPFNSYPARMSPFTAFGFLATGVGLLFLAGRQRSTVAISQVAILAAMMTALLGLMGYAYGMSAFYRGERSSSMAIHTAFTFLVLGCGILAARPERGLASLLNRGTSGSVLARRLLPAALVVPLVLGWLRIKGEQAGYYDLPMGTALLVAALIVIFVALILRTALSLDRSDLARQRTENELRESETAKAAILTSALDCIIAMDRQGRVIEWNPAAETTFGYSRVDAIGKPLAELIIPVRFREAHWRGLSRFLELGEGPLIGKRIEMPALHSDGSEFPVELSILVSRGADLFFTAYLRDITERKKFEGELAEKARLLDLTNDAVVVRDTADRVIFWNQGAEKLYGWTCEEASGKKLRSLLQTEFPQPIEEIEAELHRAGKFTGEVVQVARDGQRIPSLCRWVLDRETNSILTSYTDMSALKRAEEALHASERKYRTLFESMDEGYCIIEMLFDDEGKANDWRFLDVNAAFERHNGIRGALGKRMRELVPDIEPKWFEIYSKVALTGEPIRFVEHSAALHRWFDIYAYRVNGSERRRVAILFTDITERKQAENALRESEEHMRLATEATKVGIWQWNLFRNDVRWDAEMFRIFGLAPSKDGIVPYSAWSEAVFPEDLEEQLATLNETIRQRGHSAREFRIRRHDTNEERRIQAVETVRLNTQGQVEWLVGTNLDITERRRAEDALRESEDDFRALGENIAQLAWMADEQGSIFWYNKRWYDYTGTTFEEMQGWGWEKVHYPGELERVLARWTHALATGEPWEDIFPLRHNDGHYGWFLSRAFPLRDSSGYITRWFGTNTDITELRETQQELKKAQEELQRHAASLEVTVAERTVELREIIGELEAFSYSLSHDMRAPLRAIYGFSQLALKECGDKAGPFLEMVISAAGRLDRMIQEVLSYTRISRQEIRSERLDVDRLVRNIIAERPELQPPQAEVIVKTPLLPMWGHEASLTQCLTNLLGNAVKFVARGVQPQVVVSSELRDDSVRLWIEDNGIGIEPEAQQKLFEMFYRVNSEKDYEGTGIGLAIVRKAVERMGGAVGVESEPGRGSRFWVQLPRGA